MVEESDRLLDDECLVREVEFYRQHCSELEVENARLKDALPLVLKTSVKAVLVKSTVYEVTYLNNYQGNSHERLICLFHPLIFEDEIAFGKRNDF
jgi:hypothetical protein